MCYLTQVAILKSQTHFPSIFKNPLRSEFGGPQFDPHVTIVGAISLTPDEALAKFRSACDGLKAYNATVDRVATGSFFYQCVSLLLHSTSEVVETSVHCTGHFGYKNSSRCPPFSAKQDTDVPKAYAARERPPFKAPAKNYSHGLKELIEDCWNEKPVKRPTFRQIITKLESIHQRFGHKNR